MGKAVRVGVLLLATVLLVPLGCKTPATFEVVSLDVVPPEVRAGDTVAIGAEVKNTGGTMGVYAAVLTVDGVEVETKDVSVAPRATETVTFSLMKDEAGSYTVAVADLSSSLMVKQTLVAKEVELKYDDGVADSVFYAGPDGGHLIHFSPPATIFTLRKLRICAGLYGSDWAGRQFEVQIWDEGHTAIWTRSYQFTEFLKGAPEPSAKTVRWVELEIPNVELTSDFYVHIYTDSRRWPEPWGIGMAMDNSVLNEHSEGTLGYEVRWPYPIPKERVNWMIRVVGTVMVPEE